MADKIRFELVSPEELLISQEVEMVVIPGEDGDFGVLPGHALFASLVRPGLIDIYNDDVISDQIFVAGGVSEVSQEACTVLTEEAIKLDEIERTTVEERISENEKAINLANPDEDTSRFEKDLATSRVLLECLDRR